MKNRFSEHRKTRFKGMKAGILLILVGLLFLGFNLNIIPAQLKDVIISWPMILVVLGVGKLFKKHFVTGGFVFMLGIFFLIPKLMPELHVNFLHFYWPVLLISLGLYIILHRSFDHKNIESRWQKKWEEHKFNTNKEWINQDGFSKNSVFGSGEHIVLDPEFKGGDANAVFGGILLDLRRTKLKEGDTHLEVNAVFGGVTIYVPNDWEIETHFDAVFGGFQDKRLPSENIDRTRKLIITGSCVFGGGEIRN